MELPRNILPAIVLIIDDDADIHELVEVRLRQGEPLEVLHAMDADTGLRLARERRPDMILLDLDLPGRDGLEVCGTLMEDPALRNTPIIFLTGTADVATKVRAFEAGGTDYVTKPFDALELRARVRAGLRTKRYLVHLQNAARQREALLRLSAVGEASWDERLRVVLREDAVTLDVQRVSYWRRIDADQAIQCDALFRRDVGAYEAGSVLRAIDHPEFFRALNTASLVLAEDAHVDPSTRELSESYLKPAGIGAMMNVPVFAGGELAGVVCHEHVGGARAWTIDEQHFALSVGHVLSRGVEAHHRRRAEEGLRQSEARFRTIARVTPVPIQVNALTGRCLWGNAAMSQLSGVSIADMVGKAAPDFYADPADRDAVLSELREKGFVEGREVRLRRASGEEYWAVVSANPLTFDGEPAVIVGLTDLTEQKRMEETLRHTALHDALTGLPNRGMLFEILRRELSRAERNPEYRFALLFFDLDGFKPINDIFGHGVGDQLLISVAKRVSASMRPMDVTARVGGDEFAVIVADVADASEVERVIARVDAAITAPHSIGEAEHRVSASIGFAMGDGRVTDAGALLRAADQAMYERKRTKAGSTRTLSDPRV